LRIDSPEGDRRTAICRTIALLITEHALAGDYSYSSAVQLNPLPIDICAVSVGSSALRTEISANSGCNGKPVLTVGNSPQSFVDNLRTDVNGASGIGTCIRD